MATAMNGYARNTSWAAWLNLLLGIWLFISAFVWPHTTAAMTNTWILGVVIALFAALSFAAPMARWVDALAAVWLFISTLAIRHDNAGTVWNNVIIAIVVFGLSFVGGTALEQRRDVTTRPMAPV